MTEPDDLARVALAVFEDEHPITAAMREHLRTRLTYAFAAMPDRPTQPAPSLDAHETEVRWMRDEQPTQTNRRGP